MKYNRLMGKAEEIVDRHKRGKPVKSADLDKLQRLLDEKIARYTERLELIDDPDKREKLQTRLKVVNAQLEKSKRLTTR